METETEVPDRQDWIFNEDGSFPEEYVKPCTDIIAYVGGLISGSETESGVGFLDALDSMIALYISGSIIETDSSLSQQIPSIRSLTETIVLADIVRSRGMLFDEIFCVFESVIEKKEEGEGASLDEATWAERVKEIELASDKILDSCNCTYDQLFANEICGKGIVFILEYISSNNLDIRFLNMTDMLTAYYFNSAYLPMIIYLKKEWGEKVIDLLKTMSEYSTAKITRITSNALNSKR